MINIAQWMERQEPLLQQLGSVSLVVFAITLVALPAIVISLPEDYFTRERRESARPTRKYPPLWGLLTLLKNLLGSILIVAGVVMLVLPGQGTVTILIGLALTNFPGKYKLQRRIAAQPAVGKTLNRIRELAGRTALRMPTDQSIPH